MIRKAERHPATDRPAERTPYIGHRMRDRRIGKLSPALFPLTNRGSGYLSGDDRKGTKQIRDTYRRLPLPGRTGHTRKIFRLYHRLQCFPPFPGTRETDLPLAGLLPVGGKLVVCHSESRDRINGHHDKHAGKLSEGLPPVEELARMLSPFFTVSTMEDSDRLYMISATRKQTF